MTMSIASIVIDCDDALKVAQFWSQLLDAPLADGSDHDWATINSSPEIGCARVPDRTHGKNAIHLDLSSAEGRATIERALALGAALVADHEGWSTLADPEGNVFDVAIP